MQRIPTRNIGGSVQGRRQESEPSPLLKLARRIREEQGTEQARAFLSAMEPFSAPNELKRICADFGISYESISAERAAARRETAGAVLQQPVQPNSAQEPFNMLKTIMQLRTLMSAGNDPNALLNMLGASRQNKML